MNSRKSPSLSAAITPVLEFPNELEESKFVEAASRSIYSLLLQLGITSEKSNSLFYDINKLLFKKFSSNESFDRGLGDILLKKEFIPADLRPCIAVTLFTLNDKQDVRAVLAQGRSVLTSVTLYKPQLNLLRERSGGAISADEMKLARDMDVSCPSTIIMRAWSHIGGADFTSFWGPGIGEQCQFSVPTCSLLNQVEAAPIRFFDIMLVKGYHLPEIYRKKPLPFKELPAPFLLPLWSAADFCVTGQYKFYVTRLFNNFLKSGCYFDPRYFFSFHFVSRKCTWLRSYCV